MHQQLTCSAYALLNVSELGGKFVDWMVGIPCMWLVLSSLHKTPVMRHLSGHVVFFFFSVLSLCMVVQYETLVDKYVRQKKRQPEYEMKTFYGQLQRIFVVSLPSDAGLCITEPTVHILTSIKTCKVEHSNAALNIHYYSKLGGLDILDITCIQCVVGRIPCANNSWAIIDRSGDLACMFYVPETSNE